MSKFRSLLNQQHSVTDFQQETHHKLGVVKTPRRLIRKRCRYSSLEKFEDAFDITLHFMQKYSSLPGKMAKVWATQYSVGALENWHIGKVRRTQQLV